RRCKTYSTLPKNKLIGEHNQINISNAAQFSLQLGIAEDIINKAITDFEGIERRLEKIGSFQHMEIYDDYAHNPMKIGATITALKEAYPQHAIHVIWRPHAFKSLSNQFDAYRDLFHSFLQETNTTLSLLPVYYAGGTVQAEKTSEDLARELIKLGNSLNLFSTYDDLHCYLMKNSSASDLLLAMGARDPHLPLFLRSLISC
ncbi:MAG: glutamate ligase domain-containing protein, partial [Pontiellaceae bacterium]